MRSELQILNQNRANIQYSISGMRGQLVNIRHKLIACKMNCLLYDKAMREIEMQLELISKNVQLDYQILKGEYNAIHQTKQD
jgi:hypothetical protein